VLLVHDNIPSINTHTTFTQAVINSFGQNMTALLKSNLLNRPGNGVFIDACDHHCGGWDLYSVDGMTEAEAFAVWYAGGGSSKLPETGRLIDPSAYPCKACRCSWKDAVQAKVQLE
jgi:hypothetical protein